MNPTIPTIRVVAAVIERDGAYLITQRRPTAVLPLLWEFPGGKVETSSGEDDASALEREVLYRLGVHVEPGACISAVRHPYEHYVIELHLYECGLRGGEPRCINVNDFRWVPSGDFEKYEFTPADEASMTGLLGL
jgi:8-oxo-dGTP diphosphatase